MWRTYETLPRKPEPAGRAARMAVQRRRQAFRDRRLARGDAVHLARTKKKDVLDIPGLATLSSMDNPTGSPTTSPTVRATASPTVRATASPTVRATVSPTARATAKPT